MFESFSRCQCPEYEITSTLGFFITFNHSLYNLITFLLYLFSLSETRFLSKEIKMLTKMLTKMLAKKVLHHFGDVTRMVEGFF